MASSTGTAGVFRRWQARALAATQWLRHMISPVDGDGPNVGANDGARLLQLTNTAYRDYRPSVQLSMALFAGLRADVQDSPWNDALHWLGVPLPQETAPRPGHYVADDGGFAILRRGAAMVMLRYPRYRFRPSQADALHLDLWLGADNLLRDGGSYSYHAEPKWMDLFNGTAGHNTVQFDGRDQMPRLSRFLFGDWLITSMLEPLSDDSQATCFAAGYRDRQGASHHRRVRLGDSELRVEDRIDGFHDHAVLRWRLAPGAWQIVTDRLGIRLVNRQYTLLVTASVPIVRGELIEGWESRHYLEKTLVPVLEVELRTPGRVHSEFSWNSCH